MGGFDHRGRGMLEVEPECRLEHPAALRLRGSHAWVFGLGCLGV